MYQRYDIDISPELFTAWKDTVGRLHSTLSGVALPPLDGLEELGAHAGSVQKTWEEALKEACSDGEDVTTYITAAENRFKDADR